MIKHLKPTTLAAAGLLAVAARAEKSVQPWLVQPPKDDKPAVLFIGHPAGYVEPALARELTEKEFIVDHSSWGGLSLERLRRFNTVVLLSLGHSAAQTPWNYKFEDLLDEYLRWGGGVITFFNDGEAFCPAAKGWFAKYGLELVHMPVMDPDNARDVPRPKYLYGNKFAPADTILPSPISKGVKAIWYGQTFSGYFLPAANPLLVDANWTSVVQTRPTAKVVYGKGAEVREENVKPELDGQPGPWTLVATRKIGNGRMVAIGLAPLVYAWAPHFDKWDEVAYRRGIGGIPSNFDILLENSLRWTAEPSLQAGTLGWQVGLYPPASQGDTPPVNWGPKTFVAPGPWYRGVMGAQTAYSGGAGTVADWVAAAKAEGLSFLVFLEDMGKMNAANWEKLKQDCKAASAGDFRCYPGLSYRMRIATGGTNHCFVVDGRGTLPWPLPRYLTPDNEISVHEGMSQGPFDMDFNVNTSVGFLRHQENITPYWDYKLYGAFAVLTRDGDKIVDDAIDKYLEQMSANVNFAPVGIAILTRPEQLKGAVAGGRPLLAVNGAYDPRYPQLAGGLAQVDVHVGSQGEEWNKGFGSYRGWWGPAVTEGPLVSLRFRGGYTWKGVEYPRYWIERYASVEPADWFMPSWHRLPVRLDVSSATPLAEVIVYDGPEVLARFDVSGKTEFSTEFVVPQDRNRHLIAFAQDARGRRAVTMEIWTEQQQQLYNFCADHINAPSGRGAEPGHGNAWAEGYLKMEPACHAVAAAYPRTIAGTGLESRRYQLDLVSPDVWLERASSDRYFPKLMPYMTNPWHNWSEPAPRDDVRHSSLRQEWYQLHGRRYLHPGQTGIYWDGYPYGPGDETPQFAYYAMQEVTGQTLKELTPVKDFGFVPGLSQVLWESNLPVGQPTPYKIIRPDGSTEEGDFAKLVKQGGRQVGDLPDGSAIVIGTAEGFTARVRGASLGYALQVVAAQDANKQGVLQANLRVAPRTADATVKAGTTYAWRFETVAQVMGNPLKPDIGWLKLARGTLTDHWVGATLAADQHIVRFTHGKQPLKVNSTPITVTGLNPNWTAGYFEPQTGLYRPIGVATNGTGYAQVDAARSNVEVVIGNVVTCDQPQLRILVTQNTDADGQPTGRWRIEVFNPTDRPVEAKLAVDPAFSLIMNRAATTAVPRGGHRVLELE
jgi:hypothetical protein